MTLTPLEIDAEEAEQRQPQRSDSRKLILLTGATGYVGGRLLKTLEQRRFRLRCMARRPDFLRPRTARSTEVVKGDALDRQSLDNAMKGVDTAYYLIHSMGSSGKFMEEDRQAAENFAAAAKQAGVRRVIYLGGLSHDDELSPHLKSRMEVGHILREKGPQTIEFQASIIIGSGSLSFEMVRTLVDRLPVMITPRWVRSLSQPISIEDVVQYLIEAIDIKLEGSQIFEIGGADRVSYRCLMEEYARQRGLRRLIIPVPVLTPYLSSLWLGLVTPLLARIGRKLIDSVKHDTIVDDPRALRVFSVKPRGVGEAIQRALINEDREIAQTRWSDALSSMGSIRSYGGIRFRSRIVDSRSLETPASGAASFRAISRIGGKTGWYYGKWLWEIRGWVDRLVGGIGMRRGRPHPEYLRPGDTLDFWRVEAVEHNHLLRLCAEMKVPGRAWLQFEVEDLGEGSSITQTAIFDPIGISGLLYWYALYPIHQLVFSGMLRGVAKAATQLDEPPPAPSISMN